MLAITFDEIRDHVHSVVDEFAVHDGHLIEKGSSERSMTHMLGLYLFERLRGRNLHVDCEYSRDGEEVKRINLPIEKTDSDDREAKTVYPDIIVHRRGGDGPNILVIEAKKSGNDVSRDSLKIKGYLAERPGGLGYSYGLLLTIPSRPGDPWVLSWRNLNGQEPEYERAWRSSR